MSFVIGFGVTEQRFEEMLEEKIRGYVAERYTASDASNFTDSFRKEIASWIEEIAKASREEGERFKEASDHPDRYSYFWCNTVGDTSHIVFILDFFHINRRHALSPDGWALMKSERLVCVHEWDAGRKKREAA